MFTDDKKTKKDSGGETYTDLDFYPAIRDYDTEMLDWVSSANDADTPIARYNILPTEIFKALYDVI